MPALKEIDMRMKVYGWTGKGPDRSTWEVFAGDNSLAVVRAMMITPFAANQTPLEFMRQSLAAIAPGRAVLPSAEGPAADAYLAQLAAVGLAEPA